MPRGGKRIGAGRKKGSRTKRTQAVIDGVLAEGIAPLAYMLSVMRDPNAEAHRRDQMAVAAAPFALLGPRLAGGHSS